MKFLNILRIPVLNILLISATASCNKSWLDVNYNPSELTDSAATPDLVLPVLLSEWPGTEVAGFNEWMGYWCEPRLSRASDEQTNYKFNEPSWANGNPTIGQYLFEEKAMRTGQTFYAGIAKIIQAISYSRSVDMLNNIPYTDAFKVNIRQPKYDDGQFIYEELMKNLDLAIQMIKDAELNKNVRISQADIMFHGDKMKWVKFANTLKLRLLIHQANLPGREAYIQNEISKITGEGKIGRAHV